MKTFNSLVFKPHANRSMGFDARAKMNFKNGYGISVITGSAAYTSGDDSYEVAVLHNGSITYATPITDDVLGYQSSSQVTEIMKQIQKLN